MQLKKVVMYGIGNNCKHFLQYALYTDFIVVAYVDQAKEGTIFEGQIVKAPNEIISLEFDEILVTISENKEVISKLEEMGIASHKIKDCNYINQKYMVSIDTKADTILVTDSTELYNRAYSELEEQDDIEFWRPLIQLTRWEYLYKKNQKELLFLIHSHCYGYYKNNGFMKWLKRSFPNAKYVLILSDMIDGEYGYGDRTDATHFNFEEVKGEFDLITSYHMYEAEKYGFSYLPQPHTKVDMADEAIEYDVFFVGHAKNRLESLYRIYNYFENGGLRCNFWITGVEEKLIDYDKVGIKYNHYLEYDKYLHEMNKSKCVLDICKVGNVAGWRYTEAILYGKKMLSNDPTCINYPCYDQRYIHIFSDEKDIDIEWIKNSDIPKYRYLNEFSAVLFLEKIKNILEKK